MNATVPLGNSGLALSRIRVGTAPIGSTPEWSIYWGPQDPDDAVRALGAAFDAGVSWVDTAPFYGWGRAEEIVGRALRGRRNPPLVFTKCGTLPNGRGGAREDLSPASIRLQVEDSLRRLGIERIDVLQFHDPDPQTPIEESWRELQRLIQEGKVAHGGLSNHEPELIARALAVGPVVSSQQRYSLLHREAESSVLGFCRDRGITSLAWSPLASGFLVDEFTVDSLDPADFRRRMPYAVDPLRARLAELRAHLGASASRRGRTMRELAVAWTLRPGACDAAIVGVRNEAEARTLLDPLSWSWDAGSLFEFDATVPIIR